jgi:hypothetical protein
LSYSQSAVEKPGLTWAWKREERRCAEGGGGSSPDSVMLGRM